MSEDFIQGGLENMHTLNHWNHPLPLALTHSSHTYTLLKSPSERQSGLCYCVWAVIALGCHGHFRSIKN